MSNPAKKFASKWFRVATAGATVDGRNISADHLKQMAKNFNPSTYGARVWLEHMRGMLPDSMFKALGDVTALKVEDVDGKTRLFAQIAPLPELVAMNKAKQKIYTSIEIEPKFADSGEAYLMGLAVTDSPASVGTEALAFTVKSKRPDDFENHLFSAAEETAMEFTEVAEDSPAVDQVQMVSAFTKVLQAFGFKAPEEKKTDPVVAPPAATGTLDHSAVVTALTGLQTAFTDSAKASKEAVDKLSTDLKAQADQIKAMGDKFAALEGQPDPSQQYRRNAGPGGETIATDC